MRPSFAHQKAPMIVDVIKEETVRGVISAIKNGVMAGARGFDFHLAPLKPEEITVENFRQVFSATDKPILALHYNTDYQMNVLHYTDDQRAEQLLIAVEAGAACVDMQGYTFYGSQDTKPTLITEYRGEHMSFVDACPEEVCLCPETIKKQMSFVDRVHSMGAEVLLSTHVGCFLKCEQVLDLLDFLKVRNPDVIKLVGMGCDTDEDLVEYFKTLTEIKKRYTDVKIHYHSCGKKGCLTRMLGPLFGSYLMFCIDRYNQASDFNQLPLEAMAEIYTQFDKLLEGMDS